MDEIAKFIILDGRRRIHNFGQNLDGVGKSSTGLSGWG